ncbi:MAG: S-methyl-5-thioribose-1-phosphate isomerase [Armatimonadota bacterium]|nr:S-methyl-5-thioribose-1-phosphate isomerase [Armatimonadota bacterium]MDR7534512.1 S-methyl-5-thioribose-1-phosphate isomerase [Armatimonadota bacterium]MDR7536030.1 S-methyl-5-thioribose-1-phosphate isomerase [Armatimonadota bacterium]
MEGQVVRMVDQTRLPHEVVVITCRSADEVADAIRSLRVRGAPAIGVAAAFGVALAAAQASGQPPQEALATIEAAGRHLAAARPTAVNLRWAIDRMLAVARRVDHAGRAAQLRQEAERIAAEDRAANEAIGRLGAAEIRDGERVLTYCHTGALATAGYGTALGIVRAAWEGGRQIQVIACETRPVLQGARLTTWELRELGIPVTLITDNAAGALMARGEVDRVVVGADRIAANGDVANKIGTYTLAVLARAHGLPFVVAAPTSTIDLATPSGAEIPIEERPAEEVLRVAGTALAPAGVPARNPAFDITPHALVTMIVTEAGVARPPYAASLPALLGAEVGQR